LESYYISDGEDEIAHFEDEEEGYVSD